MKNGKYSVLVNGMLYEQVLYNFFSKNGVI